MKNNRFPTLALAAWMVLGAVATASALPIFSSAPATPQRIQLAQGDCYAVGQQIAAENGGTLAKATPEDRGGQQVCVIVVLVPGQDGQRPRRAEFVVPM
jgi:hypothetical protein